MKIQLLLFCVVAVSAFLFSCSKTSAPTGASELTAAEQAQAMIAAGALLIDVRSVREFSGGSLDGAINIPHNELSKRLDEVIAHKDEGVVVFCRSGNRSGIAERILEKNGFVDVLNGGGYKDLK